MDNRIFLTSGFTGFANTDDTRMLDLDRGKFVKGLDRPPAGPTKGAALAAVEVKHFIDAFNTDTRPVWK